MQPLLRNASLLLPLSLILAAAPPELVSRRGVQTPGTGSANGASTGASYSGNGRYAVFTSDAPDLVANGGNGPRLDVFRRDLVAGTNELVSAFGAGPSTGHSYGGSASEDGLRVAFLSEGTEHGQPDANQGADAFVRHFAGAGGGPATSELISVRAGGTGTGNGVVNDASISADGRFVLFESLASDLVADPDTNSVADIFLRDLLTQTTVRLSSRSGANGAGNGASHDAVMSADAGVVVFRSDATDLTPPVTGNVTDLYLWSRSDGSLRRFVVPGAPLAANRLPVRAMNPALSADGRYLAFRTAAGVPDNQVNGIWWHDLAAGTNAPASVGLNVATTSGPDDTSGPVMSADGRTIAFESLVNTGETKVHLWKADSGVHTMESLMQTVPPTGGEPATSGTPVLSADGSQIAFLTQSPVPGTDITVGGEFRLIVRTLVTGQTRALPVAGPDFAYDLPFPEFSPDGAKLLFQTEMTVGKERDDNVTFDLFQADLATGELDLVSVAESTTAPATPSGFSSTPGQALSADGRFVVFVSDADDVVAGDTNQLRDIFRLDRQTGQTVQVSQGLNGQGANGASTTVQVSPDGRFVLFTSNAKNLVPNDTNNQEDVFLGDLTTGTTVLVSAKDAGDGSSATSAASFAASSSDGKVAIFLSSARDLVGPFFGGLTGNNAFLRFPEQQRTVLISRDNIPAGINIQGRVIQFGLSADGRVAGFVAGGGSQRDVYVYDVPSETLRRLTTNQSVLSFVLAPSGDRIAYVASPAGQLRRLLVQDPGTDTPTVAATLTTTASVEPLRFSRDGRSLAFVTTEALPTERTGIADTNGVSDVFLYDLNSTILNLVSVGDAGQLGNGAASHPQLSGDGRRVGFRSTASNLTPGDANNLADVFLYEVATGHSTLLSANAAGGGPGVGLSTTPAISDDGSYVTFVSSVSDFVTGDDNSATDVFGVVLATSGGGDEDHDGLLDEWELTHFGNRDQTAEGDADGDGQSNGSEFAAGTNPTSAASVFRVFLARDAAATVTLTWQSQTGITYVVETSAALSPAAFTATGSPIPGDASMKSVTLDATAEAGFIRVRAQR